MTLALAARRGAPGRADVVARRSGGAGSSARPTVPVARASGCCAPSWPSCTCSPASPSSTATGCCDAQPMRMWLADRTTDSPSSARSSTSRAVAHVRQLGGRRVRPHDRRLAAVAPQPAARLRRRRRVPPRHVRLFQIGVFPWVMIASTPSSSRPTGRCRLIRRFRSRRPPLPDVDARSHRCRCSPWESPARTAHGGGRRLGRGAGGDSRRATSPIAGDVRWTEEGYYGSYRVMLTEKAGWLMFASPTGRTGEHMDGRARPSCSRLAGQAGRDRDPTSRSTAAHLVAELLPRRGAARWRCAPTRGSRSTAAPASGWSTRPSISPRCPDGPRRRRTCCRSIRRWASDPEAASDRSRSRCSSSRSPSAALVVVLRHRR